MRRIAVLTSGGDAPDMNPAIRAVVKLAAGRDVDVMGVENGYDGLIDGRFQELRPTHEIDAVDVRLLGVGHEGAVVEVVGHAVAVQDRLDSARSRSTFGR
jgi:hypothetical protein